jgi:hypothetical protein
MLPLWLSLRLLHEVTLDAAPESISDGALVVASEAIPDASLKFYDHKVSYGALKSYKLKNPLICKGFRGAYGHIGRHDF